MKILFSHTLAFTHTGMKFVRTDDRRLIFRGLSRRIVVPSFKDFGQESWPKEPVRRYFPAALPMFPAEWRGGDSLDPLGPVLLEEGLLQTGCQPLPAPGGPILNLG